MNTLTEWGLSAPAAPPPNPLTDALVGSALGVIAGGLAGAYFKHTTIGAVAGGMLGGAGGYYYATSYQTPPAQPGG